MYSLIDRLRRNTASVTIKGRVVMFTDGKCNSNRLRENEDEDVHNPSESMQDVRTSSNCAPCFLPNCNSNLITCSLWIYLILFFTFYR